MGLYIPDYDEWNDMKERISEIENKVYAEDEDETINDFVDDDAVTDTKPVEHIDKDLLDNKYDVQEEMDDDELFKF
jgi:hypothetical protein